MANGEAVMVAAPTAARAVLHLNSAADVVAITRLDCLAALEVEPGKGIVVRPKGSPVGYMFVAMPLSRPGS